MKLKIVTVMQLENEGGGKLGRMVPESGPTEPEEWTKGDNERKKDPIGLRWGLFIRSDP